MSLLEHIKHLRKKPSEYIENYLYIRPKNTPLKLFTLRPSQRIIMDIVEQDIAEGRPERYIICKNRQVGGSTLSEALTFHHTTLNPSYHSLLVTPDREKSQDLFRISQLFYDRLPNELKPMKLYRTKNNLILENPDEKDRVRNPGLGSSLMITQAKQVAAPRGLALSAAHFSEVPYYDFYMPELYPAIDSAIPKAPGTLIILESTPKGRGGWFYEMYMGAKLKNHKNPLRRAEWNGFTPIFLPWYIDTECRFKYPISDEEALEIMNSLDDEETELYMKYQIDVYQIKWRRERIAGLNGDVAAFRFENPTTEEEAFALSGTYMFTPEAREHYINSVKPGLRGFLYFPTPTQGHVRFRSSQDENAPFEIFKAPERGMKYTLGVDPAYGKGQDYSAMVVMDENYEVVATYYSNIIPPEIFMDDIVRMQKFYNNALFILETTGPGNGMMYMLRKKIDERYWWKWEKWDAVGKRRVLQSVGWDAINRSISALDSLLSWAINTKRLKIQSEDLINELTMYQYDPDRERGAAPWGEHDDLVRACGLALTALEQIGIVAYEKKDKTPSVFLPPNMGSGYNSNGEDYLW
jgi:hypothetical protein